MAHYVIKGLGGAALEFCPNIQYFPVLPLLQSCVGVETCVRSIPAELELRITRGRCGGRWGMGRARRLGKKRIWRRRGATTGVNFTRVSGSMAQKTNDAKWALEHWDVQWNQYGKVMKERFYVKDYSPAYAREFFKKFKRKHNPNQTKEEAQKIGRKCNYDKLTGKRRRQVSRKDVKMSQPPDWEEAVLRAKWDAMSNNILFG